MKRLIVSLIAIFMVLGIACTAYAAEGDIMKELEEMLQQEKGNTVLNENAEQIPEGTNNNTALNTNTNTNTTGNENLPEKTPHAGIGDYSGLVLVGMFAVSSVYAYKKVREYNA